VILPSQIGLVPVQEFPNSYNTTVAIYCNNLRIAATNIHVLLIGDCIHQPQQLQS
jgi:hypothetical protein